MIRRMTISEDNVPQTVRVSESIVSSSGSIFVETGFPVSWGIVQNASVGQISADDEIGPLFFYPNSPTSNLTYNVGDISSEPGVVYVSGSLQIYYNGILLTKDIDYTEDAGNEEFTLIVDGGDGLATNPGSGDELALNFVKNITFTSPSATTTISVRIPAASTGFYIDYEDISGSMILVDIVYR